MRTLDEILLDVHPPLESLSVVKVDTAGSECDVLATGGSGSNAPLIFTRLRPELMLINVDSPRSQACVSALAAAHAYSVHPFKTHPPPRPAASARSKAVPFRTSQHVVLVNERRGPGR